MKFIVLLVLLVLQLTSSMSHASNLRSEQLQRQLETLTPLDNPGTARIVGGSDTDFGDYPFMSALVSVSQQLSTTALVNNITYSSNEFDFSPIGQVSGQLVSCGKAGEVCIGVEDKICLIERGTFTFAAKTLNCQAGGGVGAIIFNNVAGPINNGTLGNSFDGTIPVVAISQQDGQALLQLQNATASIGVTVIGGSTQNASCGATFLGEKWVLTAAHCVDSEFSNQLRVNVGEYDLRDGADDAVAISQIYIHPNYVSDEFDNDVALLELVRNVDAPVIQLADAQLTDQLADANAIAKSIGWGGRLGYGPNRGDGPTGNFPDILQEVELPLLTNNQCRQIFADSRRLSVTETGVTEQMICAAIDMGGKSACQGDSGGPLFVETESGPMQVGITSWGIGCAARGYPGVYARVGALLEFINATRFGLVISGQSRLANTPVASAINQTYTVTNNSNNSVSPSFSLTNSMDFTLSSENCLLLTAGQSCEISITMNAASAGLKQTNLSINSDIPETPTIGMSVQGFVVEDASSLRSAIGPENNDITLFSGGDRPWQVNFDGGVSSGDIDDKQESILVAKVIGEGQLRFEWSVSSEENEDEPDEPFDALYLILNGQQQAFISGDEGFTSYTLELSTGTNLIEWTYRKDANTAKLDDRGRVRNLVFTTAQDPVFLPTPAPSAPDSSGGSLSTLLLILLFNLTWVCVKRSRVQFKR
jgi:secreted trypsin-like serine protease